jgi:SAM-dependent methyltransferase
MPRFDRDVLKRTFGAIPELYDEVRPDYPVQLVEAVLAPFGYIAPRTLEIGCGTGQATSMFGAAGCPLLALDIGAGLVALAARRLEHLANVRFVVAPFETAELPECGFDLLISAQAFHWIDPAVGFPKAHRLLRSGGRLALFWNFLSLERTTLLRELRAILLRHAPVFVYLPDASTARFEQFADEWRAAVVAADLFSAATVSSFARELPFSRARLLKLLATFSWVRTLEEPVSRSLFADTGALLGAVDEPLHVPVRTLLIGARKSACASDD